MEPMHDSSARDTQTSKTEGRLKLMLGKRHAKKLKKGKKSKEKADFKGKGGPVENMAKFGVTDDSQTFKKSDNVGKLQ